ncbi:MAG: hypothetical protein ACRC4L_01245 [Mycoplasma sp.]
MYKYNEDNRIKITLKFDLLSSLGIIGSPLKKMEVRRASIFYWKYKMNKKHWKSLKWEFFFIEEFKYNHYEGVDSKKLRPVLVFCNSHNLNNKALCFYCTKKKLKNTTHCFNLGYAINNKTETWIDTRRQFLVNISDLKIRSTTLKNKEAKEFILNAFKDIYSIA